MNVFTGVFLTSNVFQSEEAGRQRRNFSDSVGTGSEEDNSHYYSVVDSYLLGLFHLDW